MYELHNSTSIVLGFSNPLICILWFCKNNSLLISYSFVLSNLVCFSLSTVGVIKFPKIIPVTIPVII